MSSSSWELFKIAGTNLRRRRLRAYLTILGIFIGVAAIVSLISLGAGLKAAIFESFAGLGHDTIVITPKAAGFGPPGTFTSVTLTTEDVDEVESVPGVDQVVRRIVNLGTIEFKDKTDVAYVVSVPDDKEQVQFLYDAMQAEAGEGRLLEVSDGKRALVGSNFGERDNAFGRRVRIGNTITIDGVELEVVGILKKIGTPAGGNLVLVMEDAYNSIFDVGDEVSAMFARVQKGADVPKVAEAITRRLRNFRDLDEGKEDFEVQTPEQLLQSIGTILTVVQAVLIGIAAISLLVGGIGVMNTMYTAVLERTREIGIMKAIGGRNGDIFLLFFFESGLLGLVGGIIGILLGMAMGYMVELVGTQVLGSSLLQADFSYQLIIGALLFSFIVGSISGTFPAMQAAKTNPVEALRK